MVSTLAAEQCCITVPEHVPDSSDAVGAVTPGATACPLICTGMGWGASWYMPAMLIVSVFPGGST